jgi:hypothetical protein
MNFMWLASDNMKSGKGYDKEKEEYCAGQEFHYSVEANILRSANLINIAAHIAGGAEEPSRRQDDALPLSA